MKIYNILHEIMILDAKKIMLNKEKIVGQTDPKTVIFWKWPQRWLHISTFLYWAENFFFFIWKYRQSSTECNQWLVPVWLAIKNAGGVKNVTFQLCTSITDVLWRHFFHFFQNTNFWGRPTRWSPKKSVVMFLYRSNDTPSLTMDAVDGYF